MDFTKDLNKILNGKYEYLKLLKVVYNTTFSTCLVQFIYPEDRPTLSNVQKAEIKDAVSKLLNIKGTLECKFNKSYLDEKIVISKVIEFLKINYASLDSCFDQNVFEYHRDNFAITLTLNVNSTLYVYAQKNSLSDVLKRYLQENFCGDFIIIIKENNIDEFDEDLLEERARNIQNNYKPEAKLPRYNVSDLQVVFGSEIMPRAEYIKNLKGEKFSVILAGTVGNIVQKEYLPKKNKIKGIEEKRKFYTFTLNDDSGKVNCVHFCTKISEKNFGLIEENKHIICLGNYVKRDNGEMQYIIKSISLCNKPIEEEIIEEETKEITEYKHVKPEPYSRLIQNTIFNEHKKYPDEVRNSTFVVFDVETTGIELAKNHIIEIGAIKIVNGQITEKFQTLCNPNVKLTQEIINLTGITDEMLKGCRSPQEIIGDFWLFCKDCTLIAYNANFDYHFIQKTANLVGLKFENELRDCLVDARKKVYLPNYKLKTLVSYLGIKLDNAHRALFDAMATAEAFLQLSLMDDLK